MRTWLVVTIIFLLPFFVLAQPTSIRDHSEVSAQITLLETWIEAQMAYRNLPGLSIAVVYDQDVIWAKGFGYSDLAKKIPTTPQTIFRIASITKVFTSTAIMQLRDAGKLRLDDPITDFLPWFQIENPFPNAPPVTIRQLLTHSSGIPREAAFPYWTDHQFPTREQIIETLPEQEMVYEPETTWKYSNLGMALLGEIVAAASGEPYAAYIQQHILDPLGMMSTSVELSEAHKKRLAIAYGRRQPDGTRQIVSFTDAKGLTPAANMSSTVEDLAKFASMQFRRGNAGGSQILKGSTLREMQRVHWLQSSWKSGWGLGFSVRILNGRELAGHGGWVGGYRTQLYFCPKEKIAVIVMTNADDGIPSFYASRALEMLAPSIKKAITPPQPIAKADPAWQKYVGQYHDPWGWESKIMILNNELVLYNYDYPPEDEPGESIVTLKPVREHTFRQTGENGNGELVIFEFDEKGNVQRVKTGENYIYPTR